MSLLFISMPVFVSAGLSDTGQNMLNFLDKSAENAGLNVIEAGKGESTVLNIIGGLTNTLLSIVGIIFFGLMLWAGVRWMSSHGNEEIVNEAKNTIRTAVIGILIVFSSFIVTNFVLNQLKDISKPASVTPPAETPATP